MALILSAGVARRQTQRLAEEELTGLEPGLGGERQRLHVDALVVAVEAPGHRLGGQRAREQTEPVGDRAVVAEVRRVGEPDDHARQELRAWIVGVDYPPQHVPERRARGRHRRWLGEELLDRDLLCQVAERLVEMAL